MYEESKYKTAFVTSLAGVVMGAMGVMGAIGLNYANKKSIELSPHIEYHAAPQIPEHPSDASLDNACAQTTLQKVGVVQRGYDWFITTRRGVVRYTIGNDQMDPQERDELRKRWRVVLEDHDFSQYQNQRSGLDGDKVRSFLQRFDEPPLRDLNHKELQAVIRFEVQGRLGQYQIFTRDRRREQYFSTKEGKEESATFDEQNLGGSY